MSTELAFALITPYSLTKSRTGGIIGRMMVRSRLELVGTRMIAPSDQLVTDYADMLRRHGDTRGTGIDEGSLLSEYVEKTFRPDLETGKRRRVMLMVFRGEHAVDRLNKAIGPFKMNIESAQSVRDTFGDLVRDADGNPVFLEPAAISSPTPEKSAEALRLWVDGSEQDSGIVSNVLDVADEESDQKTLVILKPDNFRFASVRPGTIIDIFSGSGLRIVGAKIDRMSVAEALEFYGPVRDALHQRFVETSGETSRKVLEESLAVQLTDENQHQLGGLIGPVMADRQFNELVQFMTGIWLPDCPEDEYHEPGEARILALVYCGKDAVQKIRDILGPTDPSKAAPGSVRREYGQDIMVNAAHASDSPENAAREMKIIKMNHDGLQKLLTRHGI